MRTLVPILLLTVLTGCGTVASVKMTTLQIENPSFKLLDNRPSETRQSRIDKDASGTTTFYADDNISPSVPELVTAALQAELRDKLAGRTVILNEFVMYVYEHRASVDMNQLHTAAASTPGGYAAAPFAGLLISSIDEVIGEKTVYVRISGKVEGQEFSTFIGDLYRGRVTESNIQITLQKTLTQLASDVQSVVDKK